MKIKHHYISIVAGCLLFAACKKDNYDAPASVLSGRLMYQGEAINVERNQVPYELYQYGFGKVGPIGETFSQDGMYSAKLFDGEYKLIIPNGQGPFMWKQLASGAPDSLAISLRGTQTQDLEVMPYYMIRNTTISASGGQVTASFKVDKIIADANAKDIEKVELYINKTQFVSRGGDDNIASTDMNGADIDPADVSLSVAIPGITPTQNYVFARVGVKIAGVEDRLYSAVQKITY